MEGEEVIKLNTLNAIKHTVMIRK